MNAGLEILIFLSGTVVGSFLNVCIIRIPQGLSIVNPPSRCASCGARIRFYDNIPIISYLILRACCRDCGAGISLRYPVVEALTGAILLALYWKFGWGAQLPAAFAFAAVLIVVAFIDLEHKIIPDVITLPGTPVFAAAGILIMDLTVWESLAGIAAGAGSLYLIAFIYRLLTKREGMGMGDVKLLAMLGAFLGWQSLLFILFVSSLLGSFAGGLIILAGRGNLKYAVPYGPFLSAAAVAYLFAGREIMQLVLYR
ncbi:MAG TPA: prepilin peptidase [Syntrophales bacterium]|nr:prepilin peptidase [Syntrophales bacterium]